MKLARLACLLLATALLSLSTPAQQTLPLWPSATPEPPQTTEAETDVTKTTDALISGHRSARITNVTRPTLTVFMPPASRNTGAAALVFPGGSYLRLAWEGEGLDACKWLNSIGMTCLLVKYRVPEQGSYPENPADLEDAQQAMRLARQHSAEWKLDPSKIGVLGFSAGGNLAVLLSTHPDDRHVESTPAAGEANTRVDARPDFTMLLYPAYLVEDSDHTKLVPVYTPNQFTPPTFLMAAENDRVYGPNTPVYYQELMRANVPAEIHMYATGGHGFGLHPVGRPEEHWTQVAAAWLRSIHMLPAQRSSGPNTAGLDSGVTGGTPMPCNDVQTPGSAGKPSSTTNSTTANEDPACW